MRHNPRRPEFTPEQLDRLLVILDAVAWTRSVAARTSCLWSVLACSRVTTDGQ